MPTIKLEDGTLITISQESYDTLAKYAVQKKGRVKRGEYYYFIDSKGLVNRNEEDDDDWDDYRYLTGNYFYTKEEAEQHLEYVKALGRVTRRIEELNVGEDGNWLIYLRKGRKFFIPDNVQGYLYAFKLPYCATEQIAQQIISEYESDLKMIFGV
jgi:hypothetical protein